MYNKIKKVIKKENVVKVASKEVVAEKLSLIILGIINSNYDKDTLIAFAATMEIEFYYDLHEFWFQVEIEGYYWDFIVKEKNVIVTPFPKLDYKFEIIIEDKKFLLKEIGQAENKEMIRVIEKELEKKIRKNDIIQEKR